MASWEANAGNTLIPGDTYRIRATVRGPYNSLVVGLMRWQFKVQCNMHNYEYLGVDSAPPLMAAHNGTFAPWTVTMTFRPRGNAGISEAGLDPKALYALAGLVVAAALALILVEPKIEHLIGSVGENIVHPITDPLKQAFSPFQIIVIGATVVAAIFFLRKA